MNPKLLTPAQLKALQRLWQGPFTRNATGWTPSDGGFVPLVTVACLRKRGLAKNGRNGHCYITDDGKTTVRRAAK